MAPAPSSPPPLISPPSPPPLASSPSAASTTSSEKSARSMFSDLINLRVTTLRGFQQLFAQVVPILYERGITNEETGISSLSMRACEGQCIVVMAFEIDRRGVGVHGERARVSVSGGISVGVGIHGDQAIPDRITGKIISESAIFDMEYGQWVEEHHRLMCELRAAVQEHRPENELRMIVESCLSLYDEMENLKGIIIKTDVFHLVLGLWKTVVELCFIWLGHFYPAEIIEVLHPNVN